MKKAKHWVKYLIADKSTEMSSKHWFTRLFAPRLIRQPPVDACGPSPPMTHLSFTMTLAHHTITCLIAGHLHTHTLNGLLAFTAFGAHVLVAVGHTRVGSVNRGVISSETLLSINLSCCKQKAGAPLPDAATARGRCFFKWDERQTLWFSLTITKNKHLIL